MEKKCHKDCDMCWEGRCCNHHCKSCGYDMMIDGFIGIGCSHEDSKFYQCPICKMIEIK